MGYIKLKRYYGYRWIDGRSVEVTDRQTDHLYYIIVRLGELVRLLAFRVKQRSNRAPLESQPVDFYPIHVAYSAVFEV